MSNTMTTTAATPCPSCSGSGVAQYLLDDSGCPCGPVYPCSECEGTGEQCDYDALCFGGVHDTEPAPAPDFHERETWPAPAECRACGGTGKDQGVEVGEYGAACGQCGG